LGAGCSSPAEQLASTTVPDPRGAAESPAQRFVVHTNTAESFAGLHVSGAVESRFEAVALSDNVRSSTLRLGDKVFDLLLDKDEGKIVLDGHDNSLVAADRAAILDLIQNVLGQYTHDGKLTPYPAHVGLLVAHLAWLSDFMLGAKVPRFAELTETAAEEKLTGGDAPYGWGTDSSWGLPNCTDHSRGQWDLAYICPHGTCNQTRWAIVNGTGGSGSSSGCPSGQTRSINWQCGDWRCQGQCGAGCWVPPLDGVYQDCFEHDVCTDWFDDPACTTDKAFAVAATVFSKDPAWFWRCH
jgi:hypothetical protein